MIAGATSATTNRSKAHYRFVEDAGPLHSSLRVPLPQRPIGRKSTVLPIRRRRWTSPPMRCGSQNTHRLKALCPVLPSQLKLNCYNFAPQLVRSFALQCVVLHLTVHSRLLESRVVRESFDSRILVSRLRGRRLMCKLGDDSIPVEYGDHGIKSAEEATVCTFYVSLVALFCRQNSTSTSKHIHKQAFFRCNSLQLGIDFFLAVNLAFGCRSCSRRRARLP